MFDFCFDFQCGRLTIVKAHGPLCTPTFIPALSFWTAHAHLSIQHASEATPPRTVPNISQTWVVEPAYLSQWFLSCFAVTCPLPMLFRIYDVIFAEGANETVMRVALALVQAKRAEDACVY